MRVPRAAARNGDVSMAKLAKKRFLMMAMFRMSSVWSYFRNAT